MDKRVKGLASACSGLRIALLCCVACPTLVFAADKEYPIAGNVVALGTNQEITGGGGAPVANGVGGGGGGVITNLHRTYTVKTPTRVFVLECPFWMTGIHIHSPRECGGSRKIALGDVLHFRIEKNHAFIPTDKGNEQKLNILSEAINEAAAK